MEIYTVKRNIIIIDQVRITESVQYTNILSCLRQLSPQP